MYVAFESFSKVVQALLLTLPASRARFRKTPGWLVFRALEASAQNACEPAGYSSCCL